MKRDMEFYNEISNYKINSVMDNIIRGDILIININILECISKHKQNRFINEYLRREIQGKDYYIDSEKIIATSKTTGKLKNGHTNFERKINSKIRKEIKANIIANLDKIIKISKIYQKDRIDTKGHSFADRFDRRKCLIEYKKVRYEVMFEIGKKDNKNTLYGIESVKKTNKKTYSPKSCP